MSVLSKTRIVRLLMLYNLPRGLHSCANSLVFKFKQIPNGCPHAILLTLSVVMYANMKHHQTIAKFIYLGSGKDVTNYRQILHDWARRTLDIVRCLYCSLQMCIHVLVFLNSISLQLSKWILLGEKINIRVFWVNNGNFKLSKTSQYPPKYWFYFFFVAFLDRKRW